MNDSPRGRFVWYELMTTDAKAAQGFYSKVVGWKAQDANQPNMDYTLLLSGEVPMAGLMALPKEACEAGAKPGWVGYVGVSDVDAYVGRVTKAGGAVHVPPTDIPNIGRFAMVADPQGELARLAGAVGLGDSAVWIVGVAWSVTVGWLFWFGVYSLVPNTSVDVRASAAGAFVCVVLLEIGKKTLGFTAEVRGAAEREADDLLAQVRPEDLTKFGLIPEFIGRLPLIASVSKLDQEALCQILTEPRNALVKQYQKLFELDGVELEFTDDAVQAVADLAMVRGTGARGLRAIIEEVLLHVMYDVPSREDIAKVVVTAEVVKDNVNPTLVPREPEAKKKKSA